MSTGGRVTLDRRSGDSVAALPSTVPGIDRIAARLPRYAFTRHSRRGA